MPNCSQSAAYTVAALPAAPTTKTERTSGCMANPFADRKRAVTASLPLASHQLCDRGLVSEASAENAVEPERVELARLIHDIQAAVDDDRTLPMHESVLVRRP